MNASDSGASILDTMVRAVERLRERLARATAALDQAGIPYALVGGSAVAAWVARVDESAVRNTVDVDVLINRADLGRAQAALAASGFVYRHAAGVSMFLDGPAGRDRDAVHVVFAGEKARPEYELPAPAVTEAERFPDGKSVISLDALVQMKLTSYRRKDQMHLIDMIDVGLVGEPSLQHLPPVLAGRLRELLSNPEG